MQCWVGCLTALVCWRYPTRQQARRNRNLQKFHFPPMAIVKDFRLKRYFVTLPNPTFDRRVVSFDVFEEPVPIDLVAEAEHRELQWLTPSPRLMISSPATSHLKKASFSLVVLFFLNLCDGTKLKKKKKQTSDIVTVKCWSESDVSCLASFLLHGSKGHFSERSAACAPKQKRPGNPDKWTCKGVAMSDLIDCLVEVGEQTRTNGNSMSSGSKAANTFHFYKGKHYRLQQFGDTACRQIG